MTSSSIVVAMVQVALAASESTTPLVHASVVSPPPFVVGAPFEIHLSIRESIAEVNFPKAPLDLGAFVIVAESELDTRRRRYAVIPALSGDLEFPALPVSTGANGQTVTSAPIPLRVESRMPPGPPRLVEELELERPSRSPSWARSKVVTTILVVLLIAIGWLLRRRLVARGEVVTKRKERGPRVDAALAALASRLSADDDIAATALLIEAAAIVRVAIESRTGFPAPRRTTEEVVAALSRLDRSQNGPIARLLVASEEVKYGGALHANAAVRELIAAARESLASETTIGEGAT